MVVYLSSCSACLLVCVVRVLTDLSRPTRSLTQLLPTRREGSMSGWEYSCCNTSLLSRYEKYWIIFAYTSISMGSKHMTHLRGSIQATMLPLAMILTAAMDHGQYNNLGKYCGPHYGLLSVTYISIAWRRLLGTSH